MYVFLAFFALLAIHPLFLSPFSSSFSFPSPSFPGVFTTQYDPDVCDGVSGEAGESSVFYGDIRGVMSGVLVNYSLLFFLGFKMFGSFG